MKVNKVQSCTFVKIWQLLYFFPLLTVYRRYTIQSLMLVFEICMKSHVCFCGILFCENLNLKFEKQISSVVKDSFFFQLRLLAKVKPNLPCREFESVIHAFITSRLDYSISLYVGLDQSSLQRLQLVQCSSSASNWD